MAVFCLQLLPVCSLQREVSALQKTKERTKTRELRQIMKKSKKNIFKWICGGAVALLVILAAGGWWMFGTFITAANSIEKLEDGLYSM